MAERWPGDEAVLRYLLGELPDPEAAELEQLDLESREARERIEALEAEMIDDYVQDRLEPGRRARFEERYLSNPLRVEKVAFARSLVAALAAPQMPRRAALARRFLLLAAALLVALGVGYLARDRRDLARDEASRPEPTPPRRVVAASAQPAPHGTQVGRAPHEVSLVLLAGASRGAGAIPTLALPADADVVRLELTLPEEETGTPGHQAYRAEVQTPDGATVWKAAALGTGGAGKKRKAVLALPARLLATDDYVVLLSGRASGGGREGVADYSFRVRRN